MILLNRVKEADDVIRLVYSLYHKEAQNLVAEDRALIFVPYVSKGDKIGQLLECDVYKSSIADSIKENIYYCWISGEKTVMVCTSAFSAGNDYPSVCLVIQAGTPLEMIGFIQEVSQAGRDKRPAKCFIIPCN